VPCGNFWALIRLPPPIQDEATTGAKLGGWQLKGSISMGGILRTQIERQPSETCARQRKVGTAASGLDFCRRSNTRAHHQPGLALGQTSATRTATMPDSLSIPTSSDPRSKRPVKRRALSPTSQQASSLDALFARPDQVIRTSAPAPRAAAPPPEIVTNVQGSSAGAGSGEFHVYKAARRREHERMKAMAAEVAADEQAAGFDAAKRERDSKDDERTRKNREKRDKAKARKAKAKAAGEKTGPAAKETKNGAAPRNIHEVEDDGRESPMEEDGLAAPTIPQVEVNSGLGLVIHDDD
jgi:hypothetical protein